MQKKDIAEYCIDQLKVTGAEKTQVSIVHNEKQELSIEHGKLSLLRTTFNVSINLSVIINDKKGIISFNKTDRETIDRAIKDVMNLAKSSKSDPAYDIAPKLKNHVFSKGDKEADMDALYYKMQEFSDYVKSTYPIILLEAVTGDFIQSNLLFVNSNGVEYSTRDGIYGISPLFSAKDGKDTSSFNYSWFSALKLDKPIHQYASIDRLMKETTEQVRTKRIPNKFTGDLLVTPDCLGDFISFFINDVSDSKMVSGDSVYQDKLDQKITDDQFTLHCCPVSDEIANGYFVTADGFIAKNNTVIDRGKLKTYLLSQYGSNKTGKEMAVNQGGAEIVEKGDISFKDMVRSVEQGILLCRFSGGRPSANGDYSGVAKNSYYIENGEIKYPISETMVSGNICDMFFKIKNISNERINFGNAIHPWMQFADITVS